MILDKKGLLKFLPTFAILNFSHFLNAFTHNLSNFFSFVQISRLNDLIFHNAQVTGRFEFGLNPMSWTILKFLACLYEMSLLSFLLSLHLQQFCV